MHCSESRFPLSSLFLFAAKATPVSTEKKHFPNIYLHISVLREERMWKIIKIRLKIKNCVQKKIDPLGDVEYDDIPI